MPAPTANDILTGNKQNLYGQFNQDPGGNNEIGSWLRRLSQGSGYQAAQGIGFQNQLEPNRQGAIAGLVNASNPSNMVAQAQAGGQGAINQGLQAGQQNAQGLAHLGLGTGAQAGALTQGANMGTHAANQMLFNAYTPQAQTSALQAILAAIGQAPGAGLEQLLQMFGPIETRQQANYAQHQQGGLGGALGGLLGQGLGMLGGGNPLMALLRGHSSYPDTSPTTFNPAWLSGGIH